MHPRPFFFFFFNDTATTEIYTLSLHDALPIFPYSPEAPSIGVAHRRVGLEPHPSFQPVVVDRGDERPVGVVAHLRLDNRRQGDEFVPREVQGVEPRLPLREIGRASCRERG